MEPECNCLVELIWELKWRPWITAGCPVHGEAAEDA